MKFVPACTIMLFTTFFSFSANAQETAKAYIKISGEVTKPLTLSATDLAGMKHTTVSVKGRDGKEHNYSGVPLQVLLEQAGVTMGKELRGENLSKYLLVRCADGYEVLFSLAETDSSFTDRVIVLADAYDGKPIIAEKGPFQLAVPGEKKPARSCFQVTELIIKYAKD